MSSSPRTEKRTISFEYTKSDNIRDADNITALIDSAGNRYVENTYDEYDRVATQKYGDGTIYYQYTTNSEGRIIQNRVKNRSKTITDYYYDDNGNTIRKVIHGVTGDKEYRYSYNDKNRLVSETDPL